MTRELSPYQKSELTDILQSWEYLIQDDLAKLDYRVRQIFYEVSASGIGMDRAQSAIQEWFLGLLANAVEVNGQR